MGMLEYVIGYVLDLLIYFVIVCVYVLCVCARALR